MFEDFATKMARVITEYSAPIQPGDFVIIRGGTVAEPLIEALYEAVLRRGGNPSVLIGLPKLGEMAFQLISGGKYVLTVRYYDETPGTYNGDRNDSSKFSHLRKGDTYERTMYIATLSFSLEDK